MKKQRNAEIRKGLVSVFPVIIGYLPVAIGFGLLAKNTGISFIDTSLFSIIAYFIKFEAYDDDSISILKTR